MTWPAFNLITGAAREDAVIDEHFAKVFNLDESLGDMMRSPRVLGGLLRFKLKSLLGATTLRMAEAHEIEAWTGAPQGFAGPVGMKLPVYADYRVAGSSAMVSGANRADTHVTGVSQQRDFPDAVFASLRTAKGGDGCARCDEGVFEQYRGIEVGHVFYLGKKYSEKLGATFLDADGNENVMEMGTYGIGVSRTMAAAVEQRHDDKGICWPISIAPFEVMIVPLKWDDDATQAVAVRLEQELEKYGIDVLVDDRNERAGVKFNDADLLGIPLRVTIGPRGLAANKLELKLRTATAAEEIPLDGASEAIRDRVREAHEELRA